jgi:hypothetical protein
MSPWFLATEREVCDQSPESICRASAPEPLMTVVVRSSLPRSFLEDDLGKIAKIITSLKQLNFLSGSNPFS